MKMYSYIKVLTIVLFYVYIKVGLFAQSIVPNSENTSIEIEFVQDKFATFLHKQHPGNRIGYRFFEHSPILYGEIPSANQEAGIDTFEISTVVRADQKEKNVSVYERRIEKDKEWYRLDWTYYLVPVNDGIEMLLIVETFNEGLPEYCGIQQCFRMSGETNENWRKRIACTPAFSEYDLWTRGDTTTSLTYVLRNDRWSPIPVAREAVGARTPQGIKVDSLRTQGKMMSKVGPYDAKMLDPIDCGLITRTDIPETWVCGVYWESTSHVTDHHPADCLHAIVNIGNIPPYSKRSIRGKIYWFEGTKRDLYQHFQNDFGEISKGDN